MFPRREANTSSTPLYPDPAQAECAISSTSSSDQQPGFPAYTVMTSVSNFDLLSLPSPRWRGKATNSPRRIHHRRQISNPGPKFTPHVLLPTHSARFRLRVSLCTTGAQNAKSALPRPAARRQLCIAPGEDSELSR